METTHAEPREGLNSLQFRRHVERGALYVVMTLLSLVFVAPFFWTVSSSLKDYHNIFLFPPTLFPKKLHFGNYSWAWEIQPVGRWMLNSTIITSLSLVGVMTSACLVGYSFAKFRYPGRDFLFLLTLSTMMLPAGVTTIPQYLLFNKLGWLDTWKPLIVPRYFGGAFNIFLMRQFFMTIPDDLIEAAKIDGASSFKTFYAIILPLCKPALATMAVIFILWSWNQFMAPLIYLNTPEKFPIAVGIKYFQRFGPGGSELGGVPMEHLLMATAVMMTSPIVVLFFLAQRYFVRGLVMTGIKG